MNGGADEKARFGWAYKAFAPPGDDAHALLWFTLALADNPTHELANKGFNETLPATGEGERARVSEQAVTWSPAPSKCENLYADQEALTERAETLD
jgi:hypothetical protein